MVTTDKCYENREWLHSYREEDAMGGYDPYSSSKGAAEIAIGAYRRSYFSKPDSPVLLASARAGNVIGGGDWALDRIVPDCIRALERGEAIPVRNKVATRPWQHVLEPLGGYLTLAAALAPGNKEQGTKNKELAPQSGAFNFGPNLTSNRTVADLVREVLRHWPGEWVDKSDPTPSTKRSSSTLRRTRPSTSSAGSRAGTSRRNHRRDRRLVSRLPAVRHAGGLPDSHCRQIAEYTAAAAGKNLPWAG